MFIDTHCHINFKDFNEDREEVISRAFKSGVKKIINIGTDLRESKVSIELAEKYENIYASVGIHPNHFSEAEEITNSKSQIPNKLQITSHKIKKNIEELRKLAGNKKVVAIGEIGLDYYRITCNSPKDKPTGQAKLVTQDLKKLQREGFAGQLKLAQELNLPVVIHCRDAYKDLYEIVTSYKLQVTRLVFHCYGGDLKFTKKLLEHKNIYFSFTGNVTYEIKKEIQGTKNDITESIKNIPPERIMLETDCPFLAPQKFRGKRNEPAYVKYTAEKLAEIKGISFEKVAKTTTQNAEEFFRI